MKSRGWSLFIVSCIFAFSGCSNFMGNLRRDLNDTDPYSPQADSSPTVGGEFADQGFLGNDLPEGGSSADEYVGHSDRAPAAMRPQPGDGWVTRDDVDSNRRDRYRSMDGQIQDPALSSGNVANLNPPVRRLYKNGFRATREDFVDDSPDEGSLWAPDGQTNYYFTKNNVRGVGDIVTINTEPSLIRDIATEIRRTLSPDERQRELATAQRKIVLNYLSQNSGGTPAKVAKNTPAPSRNPASASQLLPPAGPTTKFTMPDGREVLVPQATMSDVDIGQSIDIKAGDPMMAEILERYPNGNYKIRATKRIPYHSGPPRLVTLIGIVRGADINDKDVIASGKLYEYRIEALH